MGERSDAVAALLERLRDVQWIDPVDDASGCSFVETGRRLRAFSECEQPALFTAEHGEFHQRVTNMPPIRILSVSLVVYHRVPADPASVPADANSAILEAIEAALVPLPTDPGYPDRRLTLEGRAHHVWIEGEIVKDPGDVDNQGMLVIPVKIRLP